MEKSKDKLVIMCDRNPYTSFGRLTIDFQKVTSSKFDTHILWLMTLKDSLFHKQIKGKNFHTIHAISLISGWWSFRKPVKKLLGKLKPGKILIIRPELGYLIPGIKKTLPDSKTVVFIHDMFAETLYPKSLKFRLVNKYFISPTRKADKFLYNSKYTRKEAFNVLGLNPKGPVIGCPIDQSLFRPVREKKIDIRKRYGFQNYKVVCMNISLDEPRKNIITFFKLAKARPDIAFIRVGPFSRWMKKWIMTNHIRNIFHFTEIKFRNLLDLYACSDLFIYPSFLEGFGMPPLEALACGIPAVSASTSALKENLEGVIPLIYPADDIKGYLNIIDKVMKGKEIVNWVAARNLLSKYTLQNFGARVINCIQEF